MGASTITLQQVVDDALRFGDLRPVLGVGGSSMEPALTIANDTMAEICSQKFNFKWNSFNVTPFQTISWQSDYAIPGILNLGWLENGVVIDINSTQIPKRKFKLEVVRDLQPSSDSWGRPFQICWLNNSTLQYGTWGSGATVPNVNNTGQLNPGPGVVYTQPLGAATTPSNPVTQIVDTNGNLQVLTQYGTCGNTTPLFPAAGAAAGTTTTDGSCIWTVVNPVGQGFRLSLIPSQSGTVWQVILRAQYKPVRFSSMRQTLDPMPDDFSRYFMQGFRAYCYQRSPEAKVREKFLPEYTLWQANLKQAEGQADREPEGYGCYPSSSLMEGPGNDYLGPAWPFQRPLQ